VSPDEEGEGDGGELLDDMESASAFDVKSMAESGVCFDVDSS